jgi:hypothetical protein
MAEGYARAEVATSPRRQASNSTVRNSRTDTRHPSPSATSGIFALDERNRDAAARQA